MARGALYELDIRGAEALERAMAMAPKQVRNHLRKAMRLAAGPAKARADATVHWSDPVQIRPSGSGARVGTPKLVPPIIEFGNKAVVGAGGKVAPHVRKLHRKPALIDAVESTAPVAARIARAEVERLLETELKGLTR